MKLTLKGGAAVALTMAACFASPVSAGGLFDRGDSAGSTKDDYVPYMREVSSGAGPCYFRADIGYSISRDPTINWPVNNITRYYDDADASGTYDAGENVTSETTTFVGDGVSETSLDNTVFGEAGFGCGSGSRGFRAEAMFGVRGARDFDGKPQNFRVIDEANIVVGTDGGGGAVTTNSELDDDPIHSSLRTYTAMFNLYKDLGNYSGFTPYVGVGLGLAYHKMTDVYFTENPFLTNRIAGNSDLSFAWSLMAGVGYQISDRAILDVGYRFIDMGSIESGRVDSAGFANPAVQLDDIRAHEIKIGLRYHFGGDRAEAVSYK